MTTTGGPEHFLADPAPSSESASDPIVLDNEDAPLPGDDIVVEPARPGSHPRRRARTLTVVIVVAVLAAIGIAIAIATRGGSDGNNQLTSSAPVHPPVKKSPDTGPRNATPKKPAGNGTQPTQHVAIPVAPTAPAVSVAPPVLPTTPPSVAAQTTPTAPPPTTPPANPPSVLRWTTTPSAISIKAGGTVFLTVTVVNPTAGTVTLGHPMSCPPTLQPLHGSPIGGAVCAEMAQIIAPHAQVIAHYTIYATDTADASGAPLTAGQYVVNIENLHDVKVTVTAS